MKNKVFKLLVLGSLSILIFISVLACQKNKNQSYYEVYNASGELIFDENNNEITLEYGTTYMLQMDFYVNGEKKTAVAELYDSGGNKLALKYGSYQFKKVDKFTVKYVADDVTFTAYIDCKDTIAPVIDFINIQLYGIVGEYADIPVCSYTDVAGIDNSSINMSISDPEGVSVEILNDKFLLEKVGNYEITVSVKDTNGLETIETRNLVCNDRYVDDDIDDLNVIYNFNNDNYLNLVQNVKNDEDITRSIVNSGYPTILAEPSENKVLKIESTKVYGDVYTHFRLHTDSFASQGKKIIVKFAVSKDTDYIKAFKSVNDINDAGNIGQMFGVKKNIWHEFEIDPILYGYNTSFKDFVIMYRDTGGVALYIDEIKFSPVNWVDDDWSATNLADFDEAEYADHIYQNIYNNPTTTRAYRVDGTEFELIEEGDSRIPANNSAVAKAPDIGATGGVLYGKVTARYGGMTYMFPSSFDLDDVLAINFRMFIPSRYNSMIIGFFDGKGLDGGNNRWFSASHPEYSLNEWVDVTFSTANLRNYTIDGKISGFYLQFLQGTTINWPMEIEFYIDSITATLKNPTPEHNSQTIADFETEFLGNVIQNSFKNSAEFSIINASSTGFGTKSDKVLKIVSNSNSDGFGYTFDNLITINSTQTLMFNLALDPDSLFTTLDVGIEYANVVKRDVFTINLGEYKGNWAIIGIPASAILEYSDKFYSIYFKFNSSDVSNNNIIYLDDLRLFSSDSDTQAPEIVGNKVFNTVALSGDPVLGFINFSIIKLDISDNDPEAYFVVTNINDPDNSNVVFNDVGFTPLKNGTYKLMIKAVDRAGNESNIDEIILTVNLFEDSKAFYNELLQFDRPESLGIISSDKIYSIINDESDSLNKLLYSEIDTSKYLRISLGGNYKVDEIEKITIRYMITQATSSTWLRFWINRESTAGTSQGTKDHLAGVSAVVSVDFVEFTISKDVLSGGHSGSDYLKYLTLGFNDASKSAKILIDRIEIILYQPSAPLDYSELLLFNSQESASIIETNNDFSIIADGEESVLEASLSLLHFRIDLGGEHLIEDISEIKITYKLTAIGGTNDWLRFWVNSTTDGSMSSVSSTRVKSLQTASVMDSYKTFSITQAEIIAAATGNLSSDNLQYLTIAFDTTGKSATMMIDKIEIIISNPSEPLTYSELLLFNSEECTDIIETNNNYSVIADGEESVLEASLNLLHFRIDLGGEHLIEEISEIRITYKLTALNGTSNWLRFWVNNTTDGSMSSVASTRVKSLQTTSVMDSYNTFSITRAEIIAAATGNLSSDNLQYLTIAFDTTGKSATMLIDKIEIILL